MESYEADFRHSPYDFSANTTIEAHASRVDPSIRRHFVRPIESEIVCLREGLLLTA